MGATISIRFEPHVTPSGDSPVIAEIINAKFDVKWRGPISLTSPRDVPLDDPGPYLVRVWLPNGEMIETQTNAPEGESTPVWLRPELLSPREDQAWAYYVQPIPRSIFAKASKKPGRTKEFVSLGPRDPSVAQLCVRRANRRDSRPTTRARGTIKLQDGAGSFKESLAVELDENRLTPLLVKTQQGQCWLEIETSQPTTKAGNVKWWAALPTIRTSVVPVLLGVDPIQGIRLNVSLDSFANAVLSYMTQGNLALARELTKDMANRAEELLRKKKNDPILATVAAYALLCAEDFKRMHNWPANLAAWFGNLPDGPVIAAWHVLRQEGNLDGALKYFRQAMDRGVPIFSIGLRLLFELGEIIASSDSMPTTRKDRERVDRLRGLEAARQRWSTVTLLKEVSPI